MIAVLVAFAALIAVVGWIGVRGLRPEVPAELLRADDAQAHPTLDQSEITQEVEATAFGHGPHVG